jgi:hypothetical protein
VPTSGASRQARSGRDARGVIVFGYKLANDAVYALGPDRFKGLMAGLAGDLQTQNGSLRSSLASPSAGGLQWGWRSPRLSECGRKVTTSNNLEGDRN